MPKRVVLVVSDFHLADGRILSDGTMNVLEDFHEDEKFIGFLDYHSRGPFANLEVELVLNGDFLNILQVPYRGEHPDVITQSISLSKLEHIFRGHARVFDALQRFNLRPGHSMTYIVGNHDLEMLWPELKQAFAKRVGGRVDFFNTHLVRDGLHIEHGHQLEHTNRIDPKRLFVQANVPDPVLNLPWGSLFVLNVILKYKRQRPVIDKVKPFFTALLWVLVTDFFFGIRIIGRILHYFLKTRFQENPYSSQSQTTLAIASDMTLTPDLGPEAKSILDKHTGIHTVIFGHTHLCRYREYAPGKVYMNTGTWNEVTSLDLDSFGRSLRLTYAYLELDGTETAPVRQLKEWKGQWVEEVDAFG